MNRDAHQLRPLLFLALSRHTTKLWTANQRPIIPGLQRDRSQTDLVCLRLSYDPYVEMCCLVCVSSVHALNM